MPLHRLGVALAVQHYESALFARERLACHDADARHFILGGVLWSVDDTVDESVARWKGGLPGDENLF